MRRPDRRVPGPRAREQTGTGCRSPRPSRNVLLRRVYLDLIGLPPTREQLHAFLADPSPAAYEQVVDRLLASPQYGERWGTALDGRLALQRLVRPPRRAGRAQQLRPDLALARLDRPLAQRGQGLRPDDPRDAGRRRDRADRRGQPRGHRLPRPQLVPVELQPLDEGQRRAHRQGVPRPDVQLRPLPRPQVRPDPQEEYFAFRAFFEPLELRHDRVPGEPDPGPYPKYDYGKAYGPITSGLVRVFDEKLDAQTFLYTGGESRNIVPDRPPVAPGVPELPGRRSFRVEPVAAARGGVVPRR